MTEEMCPSNVNDFREEAIEHVKGVLKERKWQSLDELTFTVRRPLRTVLLSLIEIEHAEPGVSRDGFCVVDGIPWPPRNGLPEHLIAAYLDVAATRPQPALMWGQRRLSPEAAIDRASYVCTHLPARGRRIVFLGDDDLVSPLVAALAPGHEVVVCDIDPLVLEESEVVAGALNASLTTVSVDFQDPRPAVELRAGLAVADPFPSGDGSFEGFFWAVATRALSENGWLISTISPSHKPRDYRRGALGALADLNFELLEIKADQSRYEVFDFELACLERDFLDHLGQTPHLSHTKDAFLARKEVGKSPGEPPPFSYGRWQEATEGHYLNSFARRAGGGARCGDQRIADGEREPTLDELWELAHQSWSRSTLEGTPAALS